MNNEERARLGTLAVANGCAGFATTVEEDSAEAIANILHRASQLGANVEDVLRVAQLHYSTEIAEAALEQKNASTGPNWTIWMAPVNASKQVKHLRYNKTEQLMDIMFPGESVYRYQNITFELFESLRKDASPGSFLAQAIKARPEDYPFTRQ